MISPYYTAVVENPDGYTYYQKFRDIDELLYLIDVLGDGYLVVDIF